MPEIILVSAKEIFVVVFVVWQAKQSKKPRWKTRSSSNKFINIHHGCTSGNSSFVIRLLKVLTFDTSVDISALRFCLSWFYHKMRHSSVTPANL